MGTTETRRLFKAITDNAADFAEHVTDRFAADDWNGDEVTEIKRAVIAALVLGVDLALRYGHDAARLYNAAADTIGPGQMARCRERGDQLAERVRAVPAEGEAAT